MTIAEQIIRAKADYDEVYEAGKKAGEKSEYDRFWDSYQQNGNRKDYQYGAFGGVGWDDETYKPKYPIKVKYSFAMYLGCKMTEILDVDFSECNDLIQVFYQSYNLKRIGIIDARNATPTTYLCAGCTILHTIDKVVVSEKTGFNDATFYNCLALENVIFEGVIGQSGLDFHWSTKLSKASITSVINALSTTTSGLTVTLSKTAVNKAFKTSEGANDGSTSTEWTTLIATKSNWNISLV